MDGGSDDYEAFRVGDSVLILCNCEGYVQPGWVRHEISH